MSLSGGVVLELDLGNTRLKWRVLTGVGVLAGGFFVRGNYSSLQDCLAGLAAELVRLERGVSAVRVTSVASAQANEALTCWGQSELGLSVAFARVSRERAGVVNGYSDWSRLGVDRWLAMLAGQQLAPEGFCVVDCGSAITLDVVRAGAHLGGYIVPGLRLMNEALFGNTDGVKVVAERLSLSGELPLGRDTAEAVNLGLPLMVVGLVAEVVQRFKCEYGVEPRLLLTGGDAAVLLPSFAGASLHVPDLVLDGLALAELS